MAAAQGRTRGQIVTEAVCCYCYLADKTDTELFYLKCRWPREHYPYHQILVTVDRDMLVPVRPMPHHVRPRNFTKCPDGPYCSRYPDRCTFAHSEAELNVWNTLLLNERAVSLPTAMPQMRSSARVSPNPCTYKGRLACPPSPSDMELPITLEHYKTKFLALLYYEEQEHVDLLREKCDGQYDLVTGHPPFVNVDGEHYMHFYLKMSPHQVMYATQASDGYVYISTESRQVTAKILPSNYRNIDENLKIGFDGSVHVPWGNGKTRVSASFEVKHKYFDDINTGVYRISNEILRRLLPQSTDFTRSIEDKPVTFSRYPDFDLDPEQSPALNVILRSQSSAPVLIPGAYGCGKTRMLAVAAECFIRESRANHLPSRVLICCHHQHSADVFMNNYFLKILSHKTRPWPIEVVRVISGRSRFADRPHQITAADFRRSFSNYRSKQYLLVITTLGGALTMSSAVPSTFFTHILIDEGAQTREPEALSPFLMANGTTRIVIAGDHHQVGPQLVVLGEGPQKHGLGISLLQRLLNHYQSIGSVAMKNAPSWRVNYRSHSALLELPSALFYDSKLVACGRIPYHLRAPYPYIFICSSFQSDIPMESHSLREAELVLKAVQKFSAQFKSWELKDTCIMTPSLKQANCIKNLIRTEERDLMGVDVITSYQMQGTEYRMVFLSTVECLETTGRPYDELKSLCHPAVFNTAITRAKSLVVAVGNPLVLMMAEATMDKPKWCWREYISRCLKNETFQAVPNDCAEYRQVEGQFFDMLKCDKPEEVMSIFRKKGYRRSTPQISATPKPPASRPLSEPKQLSQPSSAKQEASKQLSSARKETSSQPPSAKKQPASQPPSAPKQPSQPSSAKKETSKQSSSAASSQPPSAKKQPASQPPSAPKQQSQPSSAKKEASKQSSSVASSQPTSAKKQPASQPPSALKQPSQPSSAKKEACHTPLMKKEASKQSSSAKKETSSQPPTQSASRPKRKRPRQRPASLPSSAKKQLPQPSSASQPSSAAKKKPAKPPASQEPLEPSSKEKQFPTGPVSAWKTPPSVDSLSRGLEESFLEVSGVSLRNTRSIPLSSYLHDPQKAALQGTPKKTVTQQCGLQGSISTESFMDHDHQPVDIDLLKSELSVDNYKRKFHQLLCREEEEHVRLLRDRCDGVYTLTILTNPHQWPHFKELKEEYEVIGVITGDKIDDNVMAYAAQASERQVILQFSSSSGRIEADLLNPKYRAQDADYCMYLGFWTDPCQEGEVHVTFVLKYSYFDRLHKAINFLPPVIVNRLFPCDENDFTLSSIKKPLFNPVPSVKRIIDLDRSQEKALKAIMNCKSNKAPVLVIGSFGTGKTRLLARAAYQILEEDPNHRVLICAHHQHSADTFITDYFAKMTKCKWSNQVVRLIPPFYNSPRDYESYCITARSFHTGYRLVVTTFSTSLHLHRIIHRGHFTHILLDEGAQTREPESIAPLCLADANTKIVIAGDHKQVGPSLLVLGDQAIQHGLSVSLLERLHSVYNDERLAEASSKHCATLLTNFRCHHALLSLPSYLFYDSALVTAAEAATHLHPKTDYPLHFICSSLSEEIEVKESSNEREVELLLNEVTKYVNDWPKEWGKRNLSKICVMATTPSQKREVIRQIKTKRSQYRCLSRQNEYSYTEILIGILTIYDIQGCEFEAVFLSTAEPTTADGMSKNPTKTPGSQYVFNTALTRSKSLVVCAGNPFLLMTVEKHMNNEASCWKDYIRRCIIAKSFYTTPTVPGNTADRISQLQKKVFGNTCGGVDSLHVPTKDSILRSFQKALQAMPQYKNSKLQIDEYSKESVWDIIAVKHDDVSTSNDDDDVSMEKVVTCELQIKDQRSAVAVPINGQADRSIVVNGFNYRKGAYNNDIVDVHIFGSQDIGDGQIKEYGRVVKVREAQHPTRYVCRADLYGTINFVPLDKTAPVIVNLPKISRNLLKYFWKIKQDSVRDYITVFKEDSLTTSPDDDRFPQIKELIPFEISQSLLFVVQVLGWNPKYRKPLGAVVEAVPRTSNSFFTERLLKLVYSIEEDTSSEENIVPPPIEQSPSGTKHYNRAFTIDPSRTVDRDDAVSLVPTAESGTYELAVLITNIAKHIPPGHALDTMSKRRGMSVYGVESTHHMLPSEVVSEAFSLDYMKKRDALSVSATVLVKEGSIVDKVQCHGPKKATVTSQVCLTYESAQQVMDGKPLVDSDRTRGQLAAFNKGSLSMSDTLKMLYKIAMKLRVDRLGNAGYCYDVSDPGEEECWQTHLLIEELMIWCNAAIADYLHENLPQLTLLRSQKAPLKEDHESLLQLHQPSLKQSLTLQRHAKGPCEKSIPLLIPRSSLQLLHDACTRQDYSLIIWILGTDRLYPQLATAHSMLRSISQRAKYIVSESCHNHCDDHAHYELSLNAYTHFTSPIRRYFDLVVQRLVNSLLEGADITYTVEELRKLCCHLNVKSKTAKDFESADSKTSLTRQCEMSLIPAQVFITRSPRKTNQFELCFVSNEFKSLYGRDTQFNSSQLNFHHTANDCYVWRVVSISLGPSNCPFSHPSIGKLSLVSSSQSQSSKEEKSRCSIRAAVYHFVDDSPADARTELVRSAFNVEVIDNVLEVYPKDWKVIHRYLKSPKSENLESIKKQFPFPALQQQVPAKKPSHSHFDRSVAVIYDVQRSFTAGEALNIWLGKSLKQYLPTPGIQLMEVAPTVRVCLQHNKDPSLCFSDVQLQKASREQYHSIEEYIRLWSKVYIAEAANDGVKTDRLIFFRDAKLQWPKLRRVDNCVDDVYYQSTGEIILNIPKHKLNSLDFVQIKAGDFVCARYEVVTGEETLNAVYHFVVSRRKQFEDKGQDDADIGMMAEGDQSCRITEKMVPRLQGRQTCDIQLLSMPDSFHRVYARLKHVLKHSKIKKMKFEREADNDWSKLSLSIAHTDTHSFPTVNRDELDTCISIFGSDRFAYQVWETAGTMRISLNGVQMEAIRRALTNRFQLIQGPPGTGKSVTGAHLAYIFLRANEELEGKYGSVVLYCGPSNKSVDVVHEKLTALNGVLPDERKIRILRIYGRTHERKVYPDPCHDLGSETASRNGKTSTEKEEGRCLEKFKKDALHYKIRRACPEIVEREKELTDLMKKDIIPSLEQRRQYKDCIVKAERKELKNSYDVILCTCNETCSKRILSIAEEGLIAQCIIDECGMASEPETITAASLCEHVVLIGDHKQLQHVTKLPSAVECGLGISLFERYANIFKKSESEYLITLQLQYRMHEFICRGPSYCFYDGKLRPDESVNRRAALRQSLKSFWPKGLRFPILFHDIDGKESLPDNHYSKDIDGHSKCNESEADLVLHYVKKLMKDHKLEYKDIAILTPYAAQKYLIRKKIQSDGTFQDWKDLRVASIAESQGDEYNIVILTTVRSQRISEIKHRKFVQPDRRWMTENLGFLTDEHQVNVGITRAKHGLIIIGNATLLQYDDTWNRLIQFYRENGCMYRARY